MIRKLEKESSRIDDETGQNGNEIELVNINAAHSSVSKLPSTSATQINDSWQVVMSSSAFLASSISMTLANKYVAVSIDKQHRSQIPNLAVIWFQCGIAVAVLELLRIRGFVEYPQLEWKVVKEWFPLNIVFVGMLTSSFITFIYLSVPTINVMKNIATILTVFFDWYYNGERPTVFTWISIFLMIFGAYMSAMHDLEFSFIGYCWMLINCLLTAIYTIYMRHVSVHVKLPRFGMVFYNNILSMAILTPFCILFRQPAKLCQPMYMYNLSFILFNILSGLLGIVINFCSLWCISSTSATMFSIIGSMNKPPLLILGYLLFDAPFTWEGVGYVCIGMLGGILYGYTKLPGFVDPCQRSGSSGNSDNNKESNATDNIIGSNDNDEQMRPLIVAADNKESTATAID